MSAEFLAASFSQLQFRASYVSGDWFILTTSLLLIIEHQRGNVGLEKIMSKRNDRYIAVRELYQAGTTPAKDIA